jgi:predicted nucleic acid-binding protein
VPFVVDASVAVAWALQDEDHPDAVAAFERLRTDNVLVPILWWYALRNVLIVNERRRRIAPEETELFLRDLASLKFAFDAATDQAPVIALARRHRLTFYDAAYLELAVRLALPLATLDTALADAAHAEKVALVSDAG